MKNNTPLVSTHYSPQNYAFNSRFPKLESIGSNIDKLHLDILNNIVKKRKHLRDLSIKRLDELIVYCDNKILDIGSHEAIRADKGALKQASNWQQKIIDLELAKMGEQKELFRDTLFLRNEWIKAILSYSEQKLLDKTIENAVRGEDE